MSSTLLPAPVLDLRALMELPESEWPDVSHLVTEDDTPVDNMIPALNPPMLVDALNSSWHPGMPFLAIANVGVFDSVGPASVPSSPSRLRRTNVNAPRRPRRSRGPNVNAKNKSSNVRNFWRKSFEQSELTRMLCKSP